MTSDWREQALCAAGTSEDMERWYSEHEATIEMTQRVCRACPVRVECLELALSFPAVDDQWGVFGGLTPEQRGGLRQAVA